VSADQVDTAVWEPLPGESKIDRCERLAKDAGLTDAEFAIAVCPGDPLDLGIAKAMRVLCAARVHAFESCEGGEGHAYDRPTVAFYGSTAEGWRALAACKEVALPVVRLERAWDMDEGEPSGPYWMLVFRRPRA